MSYNSSIIKKIYDSSPYLIKNTITSSYGFLQRKKRYKDIFHEQVELLTESQFWNNEQLIDYQNKRIISFISEINGRIPFYRNKNDLGKHINGWKDLIYLPVLHKYVVKQDPSNFYNQNIQKVIWGHTSGTTGSAMHFPISNEAYQIEYAFRYMHYNWAGINLLNRDRVALCAGHPVAASNRSKPPFWSYDIVNNHLIFSSYHLSESNIKYYIEKLESFNPALLHGYPSSVFLLALAYQKYGRKKLKLKSIITSSETLQSFQRKRIEDAFQVKVYNWYGTSEMSANIVECEEGELHLKQEHSFIEILDKYDQPCNPGETGRIISTNFNNSAFPLIRYDVGDMVSISDNQIAKCSRSGLLIDKIEGRMEDYIITPDGRFIGRLDHLFKDSINIKEAQIEQLIVDEVILRIVPENSYSKSDERIVLKEARLRLGNSIKIIFDYVDEIPRTTNGKFRFILSNLKLNPEYKPENY